MWTELFSDAIFILALAYAFMIIKQQGKKYNELNIRLVSLETENKAVVEGKRDDIMDIPHSWLSQVAAAERGEGVRV